MSFNPALSVEYAKRDVGYREGLNNRNRYSYWQYGQFYNPWCSSATSKWAWDAGFRFWPSSACGERGDYNVTSLRRNAERYGVWRQPSWRAAPGSNIVLNFGQHPEQHVELVLADAGGSTIATIGGNTGDAVMFRTRYRYQVTGFVDLPGAGQTDPNAYVPSPKETKIMGQVASCPVPGTRTQEKAPWRGRYPMVDAFLNPDGTWELRGMNGAILSEQNAATFGLSRYKLGKLQKPIRSINPVFQKVKTRGGTLKWSGEIAATAEDGGVFRTRIKRIEYL